MNVSDMNLRVLQIMSMALNGWARQVDAADVRTLVRDCGVDEKEAVMQQYTIEHQRAEALQQKVEELQQYVDAKDELLQQFQQKINDTVPKLNLAIRMLKNIAPEEDCTDAERLAVRHRCLTILQATCAEEITLLNQIPNLEELLNSEDFALLRQFNIVS